MTIRPALSPLTTVLPLADNDQLSTHLQHIAAQLELPADQLPQNFEAEHAETLPLLLPSGKRVFLLGLGKAAGFQEILKAFRSFSHKQRSRLTGELAIDFRQIPLLTQKNKAVEAAVNGLTLGTYHIGRFKTQNGDDHPMAADDAVLSIIVTENQDTEAALAQARRGQTVAQTQQRILDLVNAPSNKKTPDDLAAWATASGQTYGYDVTVLDKAKIEATGLHALLAVNRGSDRPPAFIIMEYRGADTTPDTPTIGLVGKGITFDTGGLSIKPSTNMHFMKSDMGGAAAVFGTLEAAARLQLPLHLVGIVPTTENSVDAAAIKPSDVINSYSGKTIEIIDTDAEGRLILADGVNYIVRHYEPDYLIDLATLTGSAVRTFGYHAAALFSNDDRLADELTRVGEQVGERLWRLPLWDAYSEDLKSDVADVRNYSGRPLAGAIGAAKFIETFIANHPRWAHLDIAGVAFSDTEFTVQKSATAFGVRLLLTYAEQLAAKHEPQPADAG